MDKNQVKQLVSQYLSNLDEAQKELQRIKKLTDLQRRSEEAEIAHRKHSNYSQLATGYYNSYNLAGEVNGDSIVEYDKIVRELWNLFNKAQNDQGQEKINNNYVCGWCKKNKSGQYWYNEIVGEKGKLKPISRVKGFYSKFCSQQCLNSWNQNNLKEQNNTNEIICHKCNKFFQGQYWYKNNPRESIINKFCSQECCDTYWDKKKCSSCSTLLTSEEICYCTTCSAEQEQIRKNLDKGSQDINDMVGDFNKGVNDHVESQRNNRERERESNLTQQQQLRSEIMQLEQNPTANQAELEGKRKKLEELQNKEKELNKSLPLDTQISILEGEIRELEDKSARNSEEESLLVEKRKELEKLLAEKNKSNSNSENKDKNDKTGLYVGGGVVGILVVLLIVILVRNYKSNKKT